MAQQDANDNLRRLQEEKTQQQTFLELQAEQARQGRDNTLAFEQQIAKEKEKALIEEEERLKRIKKIETYYNLFAAYSNDPETGPAEAAGKALIQLKIGEGIAAKLEDGGIISDAVAQQNGGVINGPSHKNGGVLIEAEGSEGIFSKKEMSNLGRERFYALKKVASNRNLTDDFFTKSNSEMSALLSISSGPDMSTVNKHLKDLNKRIDELPSKMPKSTSFVDDHGNLVTRDELKNSVSTNIKQKKRFL